MRRPVLAALSVLPALFAGACADNSSPVAPKIAAVTAAPHLSADVTHEPRTDYPYFALCDGSTLALNARLVYVTRVTTPSSGGFKFSVHEDFSGRATSSTGDAYTVNGSYNYTDNFAFGEAMTQVQHINLLGHGGIPDQRFDLVAHMTFDANGSLTALTYKNETVCQGS